MPVEPGAGEDDGARVWANDWLWEVWVASTLPDLYVAGSEETEFKICDATAPPTAPTATPSANPRPPCDDLEEG